MPIPGSYTFFCASKIVDMSDLLGHFFVYSKRQTEIFHMNKEVKEELRIRKKMMVLEFAERIGNVVKACREFEVPKSSFYEWKKKFHPEGAVKSFDNTVKRKENTP